MGNGYSTVKNVSKDGGIMNHILNRKRKRVDNDVNPSIVPSASRPRLGILSARGTENPSPHCSPRSTIPNPQPKDLIYHSTLSKVFLVNSKYPVNLDLGNSKNEQETKPTQQVIIKVLNKEYPHPREIRRFYNEYEILKSVPPHPGIRKCLARAKHNGKHSLFLEWFDGITAKQCGKVSIEVFLDLSQKIASTLAELHSNRIIHKDLSANNILVNLTSRNINIIDFGMSIRIVHDTNHQKITTHLEGTLHYISPEQTGRMNRVVDHRSDLYSLGVVFYYMLSGKVPFESSDMKHLIHMHTTQLPIPLKSTIPNFPFMLSDLVDKLMQKNPENRYYSAKGILYDLKVMSSQLQSNGQILSGDEWSLASKDFSDRFELPQQLYGRARHIEILLSSYDLVCNGNTEVVFVQGYSGSGKSSLVQEVRMTILKKKGYFISGHFEPMYRAPYSAILEGFQEFCNILLTLSEETLGYYRNHMQDTVGTEGKLLTDAIPSLELIIGKQPDCSPNRKDMGNRFYHVFKKFITAVCLAKHPIVLFIDDLQWADQATLKLLSCIMTDRKITNLLFIGAFRTNELTNSHPLKTAISYMEENEASIKTIEIGNLRREEINELISDTFNESLENTTKLMDLIHKKTNGNAFFVRQFLTSLYKDKQLYFSEASCKWVWDMDAIHSKNITYNVVELLTSSIRKLPKKIQEVLKLASCVGRSFELSIMKGLFPEEDVKLILEEAVFLDMITSSFDEGNHVYYFSHDQIRETFYDFLMEDQERSASHLRIAQVFHKKYEHDWKKLEENIFVIADQANLATIFVTKRDCRGKLALANLMAGEKARKSSLFDLALSYLTEGIQLLDESHWKDEFELCLKLHNEAAHVAYCTNNATCMNQMIDTIFLNVESFLDKARAYTLRLRFLFDQNEIRESYYIGAYVLRHLGEKVPESVNIFLLGVGLLKLKWMLCGQKKHSIMSLPIMVDKRAISVISIMSTTVMSCFVSELGNAPYLAFRMVQLTLEFGLTRYSAYGFAIYGLLLSGIGDVEEAYLYGKIALQIMDKFQEKELTSQTYCIIFFFINIWKEHIHLTLEPLKRGYEIGLESGGIVRASFSCGAYLIMHSFMAGKPLKKLEEDARVLTSKMHQHNQGSLVVQNEIMRHAILMFLGQPNDSHILTAQAIPHVLNDGEIGQENMLPYKIMWHFCLMIREYYFQKYDEAAESADRSRAPLQEKYGIVYMSSLHFFYDGLIAMEMARKTPNNSKFKKIATKCTKKLKSLANKCPANFQNKLCLLEAEMSLLNNNRQSALKSYEMAIQLGEQYNFMNEEALAYERCGIFHLETGCQLLAAHFLSRAYQAYREWGSEAKMKQMKVTYGDHILTLYPLQTMKDIFVGTIAKTQFSVDPKLNEVNNMHLVHQVSASIASDVILSSLLEKLTNIMIEYTRAQRAVIVLADEDSDDLYIQAEREVFEEEASILQNISVKSNTIAATIVHYVSRTKTYVLIDDAQLENKFCSDPYIQKEKSRSIYCMPITERDHFVGAIYLENNLGPGVFTQNQLVFLALLSNQIAVSINNALLHKKIEEEFAEDNRRY